MLSAKSFFLGVSPGLVVKGDDSCSRGAGSNPGAIYCMDIFTYICCKNGSVCLKRPKINKKRPGLAHLKKLKEYFF